MPPLSEVDSHRSQASPRRLFKQPLALQWREGGVVKRLKEGERQAGRFELFLDLLFVAILANFAENLAERATGAQLVKYILILAPAWHVWSDLRELMNSFYNDDLLQRVLILWIMAILVIYGNNAVLVDEDIGAMRAAVGSYMVARWSSNTIHLVYSFSSYHHRAQQRLWFVLSGCALCIYIPLYVENLSFRSKIAVAAVGIIVEECIWMFCYSPAAMKLVGAVYTTAVDIPHEVDRFAAFYIIVLGEYLYQIIVTHPAAIGFNLRLLRAIWTLVIAFCLNWMYVHCDGSVDSTHPLRHNVYAAFAWVTIHLPLTAGLLVGGHVAALSAKVDEIHGGELWLLCGGLCVGLVFLWVMALLTKSDDPNGALYLPKASLSPRLQQLCTADSPQHARLIMRPVSAVIIVCLPLSHSLDITSTLSIIMALIVTCVVWENVTSLKRGEPVWEKWENTSYPNKDPEAGVVEEEKPAATAENGESKML